MIVGNNYLPRQQPRTAVNYLYPKIWQNVMRYIAMIACDRGSQYASVCSQQTVESLKPMKSYHFPLPLIVPSTASSGKRHSVSKTI